MISIDAAKRVLGYTNERTSMEVYLQEGASLSRVKSQLKDLLGEGFRVLDSDQQHAELLNAVKIEKLFVYISLTFITLIASFNIFFSLSMLAIEKRRDMSVLFAFGATKNLVKGIFVKQGIIIAVAGSVVGLSLGLLLVWIQKTYGLIGLGMSNAVTQAYPVKIIWTDFLMVGISIAVITILTAYRPAVLASKVNPIDYLD
jgi:lipoprotein-releasing system permease protein